MPEPSGEMLERDLYENCQIHLAYIGKDQYATLQWKPFIEQSEPLTAKSILEPMKIRHLRKHDCQQELMDLSMHTNRSMDMSTDISDAENSHKIQNALVGDGEQEGGMLGNTIDTATKINDSPEHLMVPTETPKCDKYKETLDAICRTWSKVKLLQMKPSDVQYYLNKTTPPKDDNAAPAPPASPIHFSHAGRP